MREIKELITESITKLRKAQNEELIRWINMGFTLQELILEETGWEYTLPSKEDGFIQWECKFRVRPKTKEDELMFPGFVWRKR
jgi:hypothetical protein